ncbi:MAG: hypothetical protein ABIK68_09510, partial [bacterium]
MKNTILWETNDNFKPYSKWGAPKTCGYGIITASSGFLFRKTHESILGAPGNHPWLPRFSEQTASFSLQVPTHIWLTPCVRVKSFLMSIKPRQQQPIPIHR